MRGTVTLAEVAKHRAKQLRECSSKGLQLEEAAILDPIPQHPSSCLGLSTLLDLDISVSRVPSRRSPAPQKDPCARTFEIQQEVLQMRSKLQAIVHKPLHLSSAQPKPNTPCFIPSCPDQFLNSLKQQLLSHRITRFLAAISILVKKKCLKEFWRLIELQKVTESKRRALKAAVFQEWKRVEQQASERKAIQETIRMRLLERRKEKNLLGQR